jgi:hypothetical protein
MLSAKELGLKAKKMTSLRLAAVLVAAAMAGCITYFVTPARPSKSKPISYCRQPCSM